MAFPALKESCRHNDDCLFLQCFVFLLCRWPPQATYVQIIAALLSSLTNDLSGQVDMKQSFKQCRLLLVGAKDSEHLQGKDCTRPVPSVRLALPSIYHVILSRDIQDCWFSVNFLELASVVFRATRAQASVSSNAT